MKSAKNLDQFYTNPSVAVKYAKDILRRWNNADVLFIEPSAGTGSFLPPFIEAKRKFRAIDIEPKSSNIERLDFLKSDAFLHGEHKSTVVIGNPPFGKNSSLAIRFFNRAADFADEIAFVLPRTFRKESVHSKLHPMFHLAHDEDVEKNAFLYNGKEHDVPCCWQIWSRKNKRRAARPIPSIDGLIEFTTPENADFAMRRVGFYAGRVKTEQINTLSSTTHYFLKEKKKGVRDLLSDIDWVSITSQTAGTRSLSKRELAIKLNEAYSVK